MSTFARRLMAFSRSLDFREKLPEHLAVMNPFRESAVALACADAFCEKFYASNNRRRMILGINPGRHGSGVTGVPFTDFKRLRGLDIAVPDGLSSHEISSEFVYRVVAALGGAAAFYDRFYISSICPLGFVRHKGGNRWVNYNYYDSAALQEAATPFIIETLRQQIALGCDTRRVVVMGKKNADYVRELNETHAFFGEILDVPHPRFVAQYRRRFMDDYVAQYQAALEA